MNTDNSIPAFPLVVTTGSVATGFKIHRTEGMSLRDYFAGQALVGLAALSAHPQSPDIAGQAIMAYEMADAMLKERGKGVT